jgi:hypothetical protein
MARSFMSKLLVGKAMVPRLCSLSLAALPAIFGSSSPGVYWLCSISRCTLWSRSDGNDPWINLNIDREDPWITDLSHDTSRIYMQLP